MPTAFALGIASLSLNLSSPEEASDDNQVLSVYYPQVFYNREAQALAAIRQALKLAKGTVSRRLSGADLQALAGAMSAQQGADHSKAVALCLRVIEGASIANASRAPLQAPQVPVLMIIDDVAQAPQDACDVYLRLHLLSHRAIQPHGCSLNGAFGLLNNVAWTSHGPYLASQIDCLRAQWRAKGETLQVSSVDKFPRMTDFVVPSGVRIADADRVRLGAHLASGTTVMHEGFVNFNAGTLGASMVEGRISAGVVVDDGSDIGGGASIMGTLSGGGQEIIRVGKGCLLGANAGLGISLGDGCTVEAGTYITAGAKVRCPDGTVVKAASLSGRDGCLFRRNSMDGALEVIFKSNQTSLNEELHNN